MIEQLTNHLWQSTVFALAVALATVFFRKSRAYVRYGLWLSASIKFFIPFALLIALGRQLEWAPAVRGMASPAVSVAMEQISEPFVPSAMPDLPGSSTRASAIEWFRPAFLAVWVFGALAIALIRFRIWWRIRVTARAGTLLELPGVDVPPGVEIRSTPGLLEPGVVGWWRPRLLLPAGLEGYLTRSQLRAVVAHEVTHIRRLDNVTAAIHMLVEILFWFHPLVWWIGARLVDERERACDEEVLRLFGEPEAYAEGILAVCRRYVEAPLSCVSGVGGSNIKKRIEAILSNRIGTRLTWVRKTVLALAGLFALAVPVALGSMTAALRLRAEPVALAAPQPVELANPQTERPPITQSPQPTSPQPETPVVRPEASTAAVQFEEASIRPCDPDNLPPTPPGARGGGANSFQMSPGRARALCMTLATLIRTAYGYEPAGLEFLSGGARGRGLNFNAVYGLGVEDGVRVRGGPDWVREDRYTIEAVAEGRADAATIQGPMLRALLEQRFQLRTHIETEQAPAFALTVARSGLKIKPVDRGACEPLPTAPPGTPVIRRPRSFVDVRRGEKPSCGLGGQNNGPSTVLVAGEATLATLARVLGGPLGGIRVIDETGITDSFNFILEYVRDENTPGILGAFAPDPEVKPSDVPRGPAIFDALEEQLGLRLERTRVPREFIVIDAVERPSPN